MIIIIIALQLLPYIVLLQPSIALLLPYYCPIIIIPGSFQLHWDAGPARCAGAGVGGAVTPRHAWTTQHARTKANSPPHLRPVFRAASEHLTPKHLTF